MFKIKTLFKDKSFKVNYYINNLYLFPNNNLLLIGISNIQIYDYNFNLVYSINKIFENGEEIGFNLFYSGYIINNDLFLIIENSNLILFYKEIQNNNNLNNENNKLLNYNAKVLIKNKKISQIVIFLENKDLICLSNGIKIYKFDINNNHNNNYNIFMKLKIVESPLTNILLMKDILFFIISNQLKFYKLTHLIEEPGKKNLNLNNFTNSEIFLLKSDEDNIIISYSFEENIKYNIKSNQIILRLTNDYSYIIITKNFIFGFKGQDSFILDKNFNLIIKKKCFLSKYNSGVELNDNNIILIIQEGHSSKIQIYKNSIIKAIIFAILRYVAIFYLCIFFISAFNIFLKFEIYNLQFDLSTLLVIWDFNIKIIVNFNIIEP